MSGQNFRPEDKINTGEGLLFTEVSNFIDVNASYSDFVTNEAILNGGEEVFKGFPSGLKCQIQGYREVGLNVFYQVSIVRPRGQEFQASIPWRVQEACPHCQGQGVIYTWNTDNSAYESVACDECKGQGCHSYDSEINLFINDDLCDQPVIRKRKAGRFDPRLGQRGDLIINVAWVDELPPFGETVN